VVESKKTISLFFYSGKTDFGEKLQDKREKNQIRQIKTASEKCDNRARGWGKKFPLTEFH